MAIPTLPNANRVRYCTISIPANAGTADTLENLVIAALNTQKEGLGAVEKSNIVGGKVYGVGTAYAAGNVVGSQPVTIGTSTAFTEPAVDFLKTTFVKSSAGAISAAVAVYLAGPAPGAGMG